MFSSPTLNGSVKKPVRARDVSLNGREVSGQMVEDDEWIYPCARALPMGFSWSPEVCTIGL